MERTAEDDMFGDLELTNQKPASEAKKELACYGKMPHPEDKPNGLDDKVRYGPDKTLINP